MPEEWTGLTAELEDAPKHAVDLLVKAAEEIPQVSDEPLQPRETSDPPIRLSAEQQAIWNGEVHKEGDRSGSLVNIARMLGEAGLTDEEIMAACLAERDETLRWFKFTPRHDAARHYREIAVKYGRPPLKIHLTGGLSSRPLNAPTGGEERPADDSWSLRDQPADDAKGWTWAGETPRLLDDDQEWFVKGWIGPKVVTLITAQTKVGKTTWALQGLVAALEEAGEFCGQEVSGPLRVAYLTEERDNVFQQVLYRTGHTWEDTRDLRYRPQVNVPQTERFEKTIEDAVEMCLAEGLQVLVVDTLDVWARIYGDDENKAGVARKVMEPLKRAADKGLAVVALRHEGVALRDVQIAGRGSSAYAGDADVLISIRKMKGEDVKRHRVVESSGRFGASTPESVVVELTAEQRYIRVGDNATAVKLKRPLEEAVAWLIEQKAVDLASGKSVPEIRGGIHRGEAVTKLTMNTLLDEKRVESGPRPSAGSKPAQVYWVPGDLSSPPPVSPSDGEERSPEPSRAPTREPGAPRGPRPPETGLSSPEGVSPRAPAREAKRPKTPEAVAKEAEEKAARELARLEAADAAAPAIEYLAVPRDLSLSETVARLSTAACGLDTETTGLDAHRDRLRTVNLSDGQTHAVVDAWGITDWSPLQSYLDLVGKVRMHTYLFDLAFLQQVGVSIDPARIIDARTMAVVLEAQEEHLDYRLQGIAKRHLDEHVSKIEQRRGWDVPVLRHAKLAYAAEDARVTYAAVDALYARLRADPDVELLEHCLKLERDVQAATWWLASAGAPCDAPILKQAITDQDRLIAEQLQSLNAIAEAEGVNWRSPTQVLPLLQQRGLEVFSTGVDALMEAQSDDPIIDALLAYRSAGTCGGLLRRTLEAIAPDGRIYASYNPIGAQTGRTSCSEPNLQQLPHETRARSAIRPGQGRVFIRADYSQLQIVIAAWLSNDRNMQRILNSPGGDIHQATADAAGCSRDQAKAINFGFLFGAGADTFRREQRKNGIVLSEDQARAYRNTFMKQYAGIRQWHRSLGEWGTEAEVIDDTGSGRRRSRIFSNNVKANTPVQMGEAHGVKRALIALHNDRAAAPSASLVMLVHDELIAECDYEDRYAVAKWLKQHMITAMQPLVDGVKVDVEVKIVESYSDEDKKRGEKV